MASFNVSKKITYLTLAGAALVPGGAFAQVVTEPIPVLPNDYPIERQGVADRYRPDYESEGLAVGPMQVRPQLGVGGAYTSNVYGAASGELDDFYLAVNPSLTVQKTNGGDNAITARFSGALRRYAEETRANETAFGGDIDSTFALGNNSFLQAGGSAHRYYERQDSGSFPTGALAPIRYSDLNAYLRARAGGSRVRLTAAVDIDRTKFSDAKYSDGQTIDQSARDRRVLRGSTRGEVSFTGSTFGFVELRYSDINYLRNFLDNGDANRDGKQYEVLSGVRLDSGKLRGQVAGGYVRRTFKAPIYNDFGGFALNGEVVYYASGLTTFTLNGYRNITESGDPNISAQFTTGVTAKVDHELLRYIILSGQIGYDRNTYRGYNRKDEIASVRGGIRYLMTRRFEVNAQAAYVKRTSTGAQFGPEFNRFEFGVNLVGKL
ncbi:MAG: hypothetical protein DI547_02685 [Sphingobium sp.]|jgi:hypothetical protein|nr:MAG: hypothetical protein DI547_02685 [Sphingobium sp.]